MATDVPFWRTSTGAEQRMASLVRYLESDCFQVRTFYLGQSDSAQFTQRDRDLIAENGLDVEQKGSDQLPRQLLNKLGWYAEATKNQLKTWASKRTGMLDAEPVGENAAPPTLEDYRWPWAISAFRESIEAYCPDSIMIQYIKLDYLLEAMSHQQRNEIHCLVDTHDVLHLRASQFREFGFQHWIELNREQEATSLSRFDTILAIQPEEADLFREMAPASRTIVCGHAVEPINVSNLPGRHGKVLTIGYLGSANASNAYSIELFLEQVWSRLQPSQFRLVIAGGICDWLNQQDHIRSALVGVDMQGRVEHLNDFYDLVDVIVNPVQFGTGLKIKNCEAIAFGKPILTTAQGNEGMPAETKPAILICSDMSEFVDRLTELAGDEQRFDRLQSAATKLSQSGFSDQQVYSELKQALLQVK